MFRPRFFLIFPGNIFYIKSFEIQSGYVAPIDNKGLTGAVPQFGATSFVYQMFSSL